MTMSETPEATTEGVPDPAPILAEPTEYTPPVSVAEPMPGTERATNVDNIILADCRHCDLAIWSGGQAWDWEHVDSDDAECAPR